ncbi:MAG: molybdopterin-dependent oxidoreductase [Planctomycetota bacterium]|nr:molybdopterin-dependent oxidoreductase [Planctomycetota bacterium]
MNDSKLIIDGLVKNPLGLGFSELISFKPADQVLDVSRFEAKKKGDAVTLESLLKLAEPLPDANYLTLHAGRDNFHVSIPLESVRSEGLLVYQLHGKPLDVSVGGPFRFLIKDFAACHSAELDDCANVKYLDRIELSQRKGLDTRPLTDEAHEALHREQVK